jgi:hypothetical protein
MAMKKINKNLNWSKPINLSVGTFPALSYNAKRICLLLYTVILLSGLGCKKNNSVADQSSYYGYGKLVVTCGGKCHVLFGVPDKMNAYDIDSTTATYSFRYQTKYDLDITITPTDKDQSISMAVYSREEKQIFHNTVNQKVGVPWHSTILVP